MSHIQESDCRFLTDVAMPALGVHRIRLVWSDSKAKWPDLWTDGKTITVTREWSAQKTEERRKRLVHELAGHIAFGWKHTPRMESLGFSTYPEKDWVSWMIYLDVIRGEVRPPVSYLRG